jgi:O-antigen/teichoic acid export membrane protein
VLRKFVKDMAIYAPSQFLPALTAFITTPILTRLFLPAEYGYWALALSVSSFLLLAVPGFERHRFTRSIGLDRPSMFSLQP